MLQEFAEQVERVARSVMEEMHTSIPGKIVIFDVDKGMATVKPYGTYKTEAGKMFKYPLITGVPVIIPQCQSASICIAFPIQSGDECLIIISEQELDEWLSNASSENDMRFDLTNAIAIPGLSKLVLPALKEACTNQKIIIANENTKLAVSKDEIEMIGNVKIKGKLLLNDLNINEHTHISSEVGFDTGKPH